MSNLEEVKARGGPVIAIASEGDPRAADYVAAPGRRGDLRPGRAGVPAADRAAIPLQLFAYHVARAARLRRRQAAQPGQERDGRVIVSPEVETTAAAPLGAAAVVYGLVQSWSRRSRDLIVGDHQAAPVRCSTSYRRMTVSSTVGSAGLT